MKFLFQRIVVEATTTLQSMQRMRNTFSFWRKRKLMQPKKNNENSPKL